MDSKHRHELEQNILAKWLVSQYDWIRPNSGWLGYAVLGVLVIVAIVFGTSQLNTWNKAAAWKQYYAALRSEHAETDLEFVAESTSGVVGIQARLALAQRQLTEGCSQVFIDKTLAIPCLEKAIASFQRVQKLTSDPPILQKAGFGLGQCWEALAAARVGSDLTKAEEEYQKVTEQWGESFEGQRAKKQLALLRQPSTKMFIASTAARVAESSAADDFRVNINTNDSFEPGLVDLTGLEQKTETNTNTESQKTEEQKPEMEQEQMSEGSNE
jgi:hypothetical protein